MATLLTQNIVKLLAPYVAPMQGTTVPPALYEQLSTYLDLLIKWNARTNLTAIRNPEEIVQRHFGESLFAGCQLAVCATLLDFGSGAGFPGLPIQLLRPEIKVTLGESQNKKATFLREVIRTLGLSTEIWADRVESMPAERRFDCVTMRAVDDMEVSVAAATRRLIEGGQLAILTTAATTPMGSGRLIPMPNSDIGVLSLSVV